MSETRIPELVAALNDLAEWLHGHDQLPEFSYTGLHYSLTTGRWRLSIQLYAVDDEEFVAALMRFADVLGGALAIDEPQKAGSGQPQRYAHTNAQIGQHLDVEVWGYLHGRFAGRAA